MVILEPGSQSSSKDGVEVSRLQKQNAQLKEENNFLKYKIEVLLDMVRQIELSRGVDNVYFYCSLHNTQSTCKRPFHGLTQSWFGGGGGGVNMAKKYISLNVWETSGV